MKQLLKYLFVASISCLCPVFIQAQTQPQASGKIAAQTQPAAWQQSSDWTLYNTRGTKFYKIALDSLGSFNHRRLNDDSIQAFLSHSSAMPSDKPPMWMGAYVTSCIIDHKKRKIDISSYGGFIFDETDKKYYLIPQDIQKEWLGYFAACAGSIPAKK